MKNFDNLPTGSISIEELDSDIAKNTKDKPLSPRQNAGGKRKPFPIDVLPLKVQELIIGANKTLGIPSDFFAASILFTAGSSAGNTYKLEVKKGSEHKAVFYMVLVGLPNSNKSGALKKAIKPLSKHDSENFKEYKKLKAEYDAIKELSKKERTDSDLCRIFGATKIYRGGRDSDLYARRIEATPIQIEEI